MSGEYEGKVLAEKYQLDSLLSGGASGEFYHGRHLYMDKPVTLKVLPRSITADDMVVKHFFDQAKAASRFSGPNVLNLADFGSAPDGTIYAVYDGVTAGTLREKLANEGQLPAVDAVNLGRQITNGLAAAHEAGVIHGNLTPENVLIDSNGEVKVFEFGSAGPLSDESYDSILTASDYGYLAPEQCAGTGNVDARSDVYALGAILYEMLAGDQPFKGEKPTDVMLKHTEELPAPLSAFRSDLPPSIEPVILKALAKDPDLRYQSAEEFGDALDQSLSQPAAAAASSNNIWKTAFIVLAGISVLSAILIYATSVKRTDPTTALQSDANGQPVQPINPATGAEEQSLAAMPGMMGDSMSNVNMSQPPGTLPGGDGYNPWATGAPPPGAPPQYLSPGGQVYTIDPNTGSPFMQPDGVILVPVPVNTNTAVKPSPTPRAPAANSNTAAAPNTPEPKSTPAPIKPTPAPTKAPAQKPAPEKPPGAADSES